MIPLDLLLHSDICVVLVTLYLDVVPDIRIVRADLVGGKWRRIPRVPNYSGSRMNVVVAVGTMIPLREVSNHSTRGCGSRTKRGLIVLYLLMCQHLFAEVGWCAQRSNKPAYGGRSLPSWRVFPQRLVLQQKNR